MERILYLIGVIVCAAILALTVRQVMNNPAEARQAALDETLQQRLESAPPPPDPRPPLDYQAFSSQIVERADLWAPIVDPPKSQIEPPDWEKLLRGVSVTDQSIGSPPNVRVKVTRGKQSEYVQVGSTINGAKVVEITESQIKLELQVQGQTFSHSLLRR